MKALPHLLIVVVAWLAAAAGAVADGFVHETERGIFFVANLSGEPEATPDLVSVDRLTGAVRIGWTDAEGQAEWTVPFASGIVPLDTAGCGFWHASADAALAFAGRYANRVNLFTVRQDTPARLAQTLFPAGVGPVATLAFESSSGDPGALDDLLVFTADGSTSGEPATGPGYSIHQFNGSDWSTEAPLPAPFPGYRHNRIQVEPDATFFVALQDLGLSNRFHVLTVINGTEFEEAAVLDGLPAGVDYTLTHFDQDASPELVFYSPSSRSLSIFSLLADGSLRVYSTPQVTLPSEPALIVGLPASQSILVSYTDGTGSILDDPVTPGNAPPLSLGGSTIAAAFPIAPNQLHILTQPTPDSPATEGIRLTYDQPSQTWQPSEPVPLPRLGPTAGRANVLLFEAEPLAVTDPILVARLGTGEWTSGVVDPALPGDVELTVESWRNAAEGLGAPTLANLGAAPDSRAAYGLGNQVRADASLLPDGPPNGIYPYSVMVSPVSGAYDRAVQPTLTVPDPTATIYWRTANDGSWQSLASDAPPYLFAPTTLEAFALSSDGSAHTPVTSVTYAFTQPPHLLDSDFDSVPDFVEVAQGLNPVRSGGDGDGDGDDDLKEILAGTDPTNPSNSPPAGALSPRREGAFELVVVPESLDTFASAPFPLVASLDADAGQSATRIEAHTIDGALLGSDETRNLGADYPAAPAARMPGIPADPDELFLIIGTSTHFDIQTTGQDPRIGRELHAMVPVPTLDPVEIGYTPASTDWTAEASAWIAAAQTAYQSAAVARETISINYADTLEVLAYAHSVQSILAGRAQLDPQHTLTLTGFRPLETPFPIGSTSIPTSAPPHLIRISATDLQSLSSLGPVHEPAYDPLRLYEDIHNALASSDPRFTALVQVARRLYEVSAAQTTGETAPLNSPVEALRAFLQTQILPIDWAEAAALPTATVDQAVLAVAALETIAFARPYGTWNVVIRPDTFDQAECILVDGEGSTPPLLRLTGPDTSDPFSNIGVPMLPGTLLTVHGFADAKATCGASLGIELRSASLAGLPSPPPDDENGNLISDALEDYFVPQGAILNPFEDPDADTFTTLQEFLEGSNPFDASSTPISGVVQAVEPPSIALEPETSHSFTFRFTYPGLYANAIRFTLYQSPDLVQSASLQLTATYVGANAWEVTIPTPSDPKSFYFFQLSLR